MLQRLIRVIGACALLLTAMAVTAGAALHAHDGRIAWAVFSAGGGGGGGFASLTTFSPRGKHPRVLGQCGEDSNGNVCGRWQNVVYAPNGRHLLWDEPGAAGRRVIVLAGADARNPRVVAATPGADDLEGSFAPGGRRIVYVRQAAGAGGSSGMLVIADLAGHHVKVTALSGAAPEFMPDGRRIAYIGAGGGVWTATTQGRRLRRLIAAARSFEISHDGRQIAYVAPGGALYLARIDGSHRRRVASEPDGTDPIEAVRFSPDGKLLAFAAQGSTGGETLYTVPTRGGGFSAISSTGDPRAVTTGLSWQRLGT